MAGLFAERRIRLAACAPPCGQAPMGREWFPLTFRNPDERWPWRERGSALLEQFLDAELARHSLPPSALRWSAFPKAP